MKITLEDIEVLERRVEEIKAVVKAGESPWTLLSYLKTTIKEIMRKET